MASGPEMISLAGGMPNGAMFPIRKCLSKFKCLFNRIFLYISPSHQNNLYWMHKKWLVNESRWTRNSAVSSSISDGIAVFKGWRDTISMSDVLEQKFISFFYSCQPIKKAVLDLPVSSVISIRSELIIMVKAHLATISTPGLLNSIITHFKMSSSVSTGSQNGLEMLLGSLLNEGDGILTDDPMYPGTKAILRSVHTSLSV